MGESTGPSWARYSWNPWEGCDKRATGCQHCCIHRIMAQQEKQPWGEVERAAGVWDEPLKLQARAAKDGVCERIFPCSPSNFFHAKADQWRDEAWEIIRQTPNLVYFVLTKRPPRILSHLPMDWPSVSRDQIVLVGAGALAEFQIAGELN